MQKRTFVELTQLQKVVDSLQATLVDTHRSRFVDLVKIAVHKALQDQILFGFFMLLAWSPAQLVMLYDPVDLILNTSCAVDNPLDHLNLKF